MAAYNIIATSYIAVSVGLFVYVVIAFFHAAPRKRKGNSN